MCICVGITDGTLNEGAVDGVWMMGYMEGFVMIVIELAILVECMNVY